MNRPGSSYSHEGYVPACTFAEIGDALGVSAQMARLLYASAMRKLRARPESLCELRGLVNVRERMRANG